MRSFFLLAFAVIMALSGCTRIETGEAGLRIDFNKQVQMTELREGSWNQTLVGEVLTFPIREVGINIADRKPLTAENTPLGDFDALVTYNINPSAVAELWSQRSRSFHKFNEREKEWHLMENYITTLVDNAVLKTVRQYGQLQVNDNRAKIETEIMAALRDELKRENLGGSITFNNIQIKHMVPHPAILDSATAVVRSQNELKVKETEVAIARKEAERMAALASQGQQSLAFMQAKAQLNISEGIAAGKVHTIVVPADFRGMVNVGK